MRLESTFHFSVAEAFHQTENFRITCVDEHFAKPQQELKDPLPWKVKTASDGLLARFSYGSYACDGNAEDNRFFLNYNRDNFLQPLDGFIMIIHSPDEYPVNIGSEYNEIKAVSSFVSLTPEMLILDDDLRSWPIEKRNCYLPGEKNLTFFRIYTKVNCEHECLSLTIEEQCGCLPYYIIG